MVMLFYLTFFFLIYPYIVYPCVLFVMTRGYRNPWERKDMVPSVSIIVSAYNEEAVIREKVLNTLNLDYPKEFIEVIVSSDGSTDRTNEIVAGFNDACVKLYAFPERVGKTACLNKVVPLAKGDIVLFTDANSIFPSHLLKAMAGNFTDPNIGLVTGWTKYMSPSGEQETTGSYSCFERNLKEWESAVDSCVGADGAIFAIRKSLYQPLRDDDINDFVIPLDVIRQHKRVVLDSEVFCFEEASEGAEKEFTRQVRITTRTLWAIRRNIELLNPDKFGLFSFFMFSHKVMRFLAPVFLFCAIIINTLLLNSHPFFIVTFLVQVLFFVCGVLGLKANMNSKAINICKMLLVTFVAQFFGWIRMLAGIEDTMWTPQR